MRPVTDLADMYGDIGVFGCGGDGELEGDEKDVEKKGGNGIRTGCHWKREISGTWIKSHWPAVYLKLGFMMRSSIAPLG